MADLRISPGRMQVVLVEFDGHFVEDSGFLCFNSNSTYSSLLRHSRKMYTCRAVEWCGPNHMRISYISWYYYY